MSLNRYTYFRGLKNSQAVDMTNEEMIQEAIIRYSKFNQGNSIVFADYLTVIHALTY